MNPEGGGSPRAELFQLANKFEKRDQRLRFYEIIQNASPDRLAWLQAQMTKLLASEG